MSSSVVRGFALVLLVLGSVFGVPGAPAAAGPETTHAGVIETKHFRIRYRPRSRAGAAAERIAHLAERELAWICEELQMPLERGFVLYLYDDVAALGALTSTQGAGGFSGGSTSHIPYNNDQTRLHEMVHIVAARLPKTGDEPRGMFFPDGLANALLRFVDGVHVHAVAASYKKAGQLPPLDELAGGDFYAWLKAHPGFNGYDVAGSFMRFLLDQHGAKKVKRYYTGTPARKTFGQDLAALEKAWHRVLDGFALRPEVETLLRQRRGESVGFETWTEALWRDVLGQASDWSSLMNAELVPDGKAKWTRADDAIHVTNETGAWSACDLGRATYGDVAVRVRIDTPSPCPVQVRLGPQNQAMLVNGTFLYRGEQPVASSPTASMTPERRTTDFLLVRRGAIIQVWIDGLLALTAPAAGGAHPVGLGIHRGRATFSQARVRRLR